MSVPEPASALSPRILVVDDNPATRYSTSRVLRAAGFRTAEASTGKQALAMADADTDAVVLDVHLPDMTGFEVCRHLRDALHTVRLPVIHLSAAYVRDNDKVQGLDAGGDAYMTHPAEPALLVATLHTLLRARNAEEGMRRSEARFRAIYNLAPSGIGLIDTAGRFIEVNPAMLRILGRDADAVVGAALADLAAPEWVERINGYLSQSQEDVWQGEFPLQDASGRTVYLAWSLSAHTEPGVSMAIATDISERLALSQQREQMLEREQAARTSAERVSRSKDEFIAVLSHELRSPLNAILNWAHVLQHAAGSKNMDKGLAAIERNAKLQGRLIADILDVSRMGLGKLRLDLAPVDLAALVRSSMDVMEPLISDKALQVTLALPDAAASAKPILADAARLQQVLWNLLTNAIKFSGQGGRLHVALTQDAVQATLTVRDEGQGIKADYLPFLFDRFSQGDAASNRQHGGLGLGLAIVQQLVALHGGDVRATSEGPGHGATFVVTIPVQPPASSTASFTEQETLLVEEEPGQRGESLNLSAMDLVVVEDDAEAREILAMILRDHGAQVRLANGYDQALALLAQARPRVLISDIGMPGKDGYDLIREIRGREKVSATPRLPAVALTAFAREQDRDAALRFGFDAHCTKPLRVQDFLSTILRVGAASGER
ncbi:MAG: response regulator [Aquabacterium sp.]